MNQEERYRKQSENRLARAYESEKPRLQARVRAAGKTWEETEDLIHDVYMETWGRLNRLGSILNLPAWLNSLVTRRLIDSWRHEKVKQSAGETDTAEETLQEVISGVGLDPIDTYVRSCLVDALNSALKSLPSSQRKVLEAQVFGGKTFRELSDETGENMETLKARKRYAVKNLTKALKQWIND